MLYLFNLLNLVMVFINYQESCSVLTKLARAFIFVECFGFFIQLSVGILHYALQDR